MATYDPYFSHEQWQQLSPRFKQRWWTETRLGKFLPSPELIALGKQELERPKENQQ